MQAGAGLCGRASSHNAEAMSGLGHEVEQAPATGSRWPAAGAAWLGSCRWHTCGPERHFAGRLPSTRPAGAGPSQELEL